MEKIEASEAQTARAMFELWVRTVGPVAVGWLGSTAGITSAGAFVRVPRWESEDAFRSCAQRPEQQGFEERSSEMLVARPETLVCPTVDLFLRGGSDDAGFVQVIVGRVTDEDRARAVHRELEGIFGEHRPDVLGGTIGWAGDGRFVETMYFTSLLDAREGESKQLPRDLKMLEDEFAGFIDGDLQFNDLPEPWLIGPRSGLHGR